MLSQRAATPDAATLTACTFNDRNGDGEQNGGEGPMAGVELAFVNDLGDTGSGLTGQEGCVTWSDLPAATYAVTETFPLACLPTTAPYPPQVTLVDGQPAQVAIGNRCFGASAGPHLRGPERQRNVGCERSAAGRRGGRVEQRIRRERLGR